MPASAPRFGEVCQTVRLSQTPRIMKAMTVPSLAGRIPACTPESLAAHGAGSANSPSRPPIAGSAGGIPPPAAHRTVRKPLGLYGSSQPFPCLLATAKRLRKLMLLLVSQLAMTLAKLVHPLRSTSITEASTLLRDGPPPACASILSPFVDLTYKVFSSHHMQSSQVPYSRQD